MNNFKLQTSNIQTNPNLNNAISKIIVICFLVFAFCFEVGGLRLGVDAAWALDNPESRVTAVIKKFVLAKNPAWSQSEIKVTVKQAEKILVQMAELPDNAQFKVIEIYPDFKPVGNVVFPVQVTYGTASAKFLLRAKVEVFRSVAVAAALLKKGKRIEPADLRWEERDVALLPQKYFVAPENLRGLEAKISIPVNSTIFEWMVGEPPLVRSGQEIMLVASAAGLTIKTRGQALADGYLDEVIQIKRFAANKVLKGRVLSANEVGVNVE